MLPVVGRLVLGAVIVVPIDLDNDRVPVDASLVSCVGERHEEVCPRERLLSLHIGKLTMYNQTKSRGLTTGSTEKVALMLFRVLATCALLVTISCAIRVTDLPNVPSRRATNQRVYAASQLTKAPIGRPGDRITFTR